MAIDLTGNWSCSDQGNYKLLQLGNVVFWRGVAFNNAWSNVGYGTIDTDRNQLSISWADPDGGNKGNHGLLLLQIADNNTLKKLAGYQGGDFRRAV